MLFCWRAVKTIVAVWVVAAASGVPYAVHTRTYPYLHHPETGRPIAESVVCTVAAGSMLTVRAMFEASTFVLFVCPIVLITMLYAMIGIKLRVTSPNGRVGRRLTDGLFQRRTSTLAEQRQHKSRSNVIRMLGIAPLILHCHRRSRHHHHHHLFVTLLADRTATQYDRLLASSCRPSVRQCVTQCIVALSVGVHG